MEGLFDFYFWLQVALYAGLSLLFLAVVFRPLEMVFPAKPGQKFFRPDWFMDFCFFMGQYLVWSWAVMFLLLQVRTELAAVLPAGYQDAIAAQPGWLQIVEVVVLSDITIYWGHRIQHNVGFLWQFHKVHHSVEHMDWLAAHREHPLDTIYTVGLINLPAMVMGYSLGAIEGLIAFRGIWAIYIHSNVRLNTGPLRWVLGAPELHHWHHDLDRRAGNYANISPLMDIIFGTYRCPDHEPERFGIDERLPRNYLGQLWAPLVRWHRASGDQPNSEPGSGKIV